MGQLAPEQLSSLKKVAAIERIGSSTRIEGSKLTDREVESLLLNLSIQKFETSDKQEVAVHLFQDGNGRLSRVLTTYLLLKEGYNTSTTFVSNYSISKIERKGNYLRYCYSNKHKSKYCKKAFKNIGFKQSHSKEWSR